MKRRKFFRLLGLAAGAAVAVPQILEKKEPISEETEVSKDDRVTTWIKELHDYKDEGGFRIYAGEGLIKEMEKAGMKHYFSLK